MSYDPRQNPYAPPVPMHGTWGLPAGPAPVGGPPGGGDLAEDGLVRLAGLVFAGLVAVLFAAVALLVGLVAYGVLTWRRWHWWTPIVAAGSALLAVIAVLGPEAAVHHHLLAAREVTAPHPAGLADLITRRWAAWIAAQLPLAVPLGLIGAGLARHHVTHTPAHELSGSAQARRSAEDRAQLRRAGRRAAGAPLEAKGKPVLGAWVAGDLDRWRAGEWCTIPDGSLGLGTVVLGLPGSGKTETLLRVAQLGLASGFDVHVIDAKGDPHTQARFAALAAAAGHHARLFPQEPYDGWRGDPTALRNRLGRVVDYTEPYYQDGARVAVDHATRQGPKNLDQLLAGLADPDLDIDNAVRKGTLSRYRSFAAAVGEHLSGEWAYEDTHASYILLDGVALGDDTPRLARYLLEDFLHYASTRKAPGRKALLIVDEFSALRVSNAAALLERLRSFGAGVVIAAQSSEGLHDDPNERARLLGAATTVIAHRLADPELVAARAGTTKRAERSHQLDPTGATGMGSLRIQETYRIDPNDLRNLPPGVAWITTAGRAAKTAVALARDGQAPLGRSARRGPRGEGPVGPEEPTLGPALTVMDGPEEFSIVEARLMPTTEGDQGVDRHELSEQEGGNCTPAPRFEQQALPMEEPPHDNLCARDHEPDLPREQQSDMPAEPSPPRRVSPYAEGL